MKSNFTKSTHFNVDATSHRLSFFYSEKEFSPILGANTIVVILACMKHRLQLFQGETREQSLSSGVRVSYDILLPSSIFIWANA